MQKLEEVAGYRFRDKNILRTALTHSSYANENRGRLRSNERLEFLGDAVLSLAVSDFIYREYGDIPEGDLTRLRAAVVCEQSLHAVALDLGLPQYLLLGRGEEAGGGRRRPSILADAVEALIGAIYLDGGMEEAREFILRHLRAAVNRAAARGLNGDYKTMLQEIVQKNKQETLSYRVAGASGPDHDKEFLVELLLNSNVLASGSGRSKKEAEQAAARAALVLMGEDV